MFKHAVALVGKNGSGKSTVSEYLNAKGYAVHSLSDIVRDEVARLGLPGDRDTLTQTANEMKKAGGLAVFAEGVVQKAASLQQPYVVFDSVRNLDEVTCLKKHGVMVIGVDAPLDVRYERIRSRSRATDFVDFETFKAQDAYETQGKSFGQNINEALAACSVVLQNDQDMKHLCAKVDAVLASVEVR